MVEEKYKLVVVFSDVASLEVPGLSKDDAEEVLKEIRSKLHTPDNVLIPGKAAIYMASARYAYAFRQ